MSKIPESRSFIYIAFSVGLFGRQTVTQVCLQNSFENPEYSFHLTLNNGLPKLIGVSCQSTITYQRSVSQFIVKVNINFFLVHDFAEVSLLKQTPNKMLYSMILQLRLYYFNESFILLLLLIYYIIYYKNSFGVSVLYLIIIFCSKVS